MQHSLDVDKMKKRPEKLSIITINYNDKEGLLRTLSSCDLQMERNFQHIIVDGNSTDGSLEIITAYKHTNCKKIIEKDNGVYDAMNKGIQIATGDYILFLNAGDEFYEDESLSQAFKNIDNNSAICYANVLVRSENGEYLQEHPEPLTFEFFRERTLCHQSTFIKRELFETYGLYRTDILISSDWEFFLRAIFLHGVTVQKLHFTSSIYYLGGMSSDVTNRTQIIGERKEVLENLFPHFLRDFEKLEKLQDYKNNIETRLDPRLANVLTNSFFSKLLKNQIQLYNRILNWKRKNTT